MSNFTSDDLGTQSITFGNSLIPVGALTTLIGSDIAETLVLGERGPAGLVWSVASAFGSPSVFKACVSGVSPGWLRSLLGLRSIASDAAIGLDLNLAHKSGWSIKVRRTFNEEPLGVCCDAKALQKAPSKREPLSRDHHSCKDIYAFDRSTMHIIEGPQKALNPHDPLTVYTVSPHPVLRVRTITQPLALALSLLKCLELYYHWTNGAPHLALTLATPFAFFFVSGCIIIFREMFLARRPADIGNLDAIIGELPIWKRAGGTKKVVLGLLANPRTSIWWRLMWAIGGLLHITSLILTYFILSKMAPAFTLVWAIFQVAWLGCRILIYYLTEGMEPMPDRTMVGHQWQDLDVLMKTRVLSLTLAVAQYQTHVHPRGIALYAGDTLSPQHILNLLSEPRTLQMACELPRDFDLSKSFSVEVEITATIGESVLSSALWMVGSEVSPMDMYDSCFVFLSFPRPSPSSPSSPTSPSLTPPSASSKFAIPAVRVAHDTGVLNRRDAEEYTPVFVPRGAGSYPAYIQTWIYWIPCGPNRWLQIRSKNATVLGRYKAEVLDDGQLSVLLRGGTLHISLTDVKEVKEIIKLSRVGVEALFNLLPGSQTE